MTTGKPQQLATESNSSDDLIAELSKLMAQDAHGSRRDVILPQTAKPTPQPAASEGQVTPFSVRIPGATTPAPESLDTPPSPRFDFGRIAEPVAVIPREEAPFAPVAAAPASDPIAPGMDEPAAFTFDFGLGLGQPQSQPKPQSQPVAAPAGADDYDTIADLIAAEMSGEMPLPTPPEPIAAAQPAPPVADTPEPFLASPPPQYSSWTPVAPNLADRPAQSRPVLRPVNLTPVHKTEAPESDNFRIPPVFGLGTTPPSAANTDPAPEPVAVARPRAEHGYLSPQPAVPAMAQPTNNSEADLDPIDEIEGLIGRAVRVELDNPREQSTARPAASPALRSLATPTMPQPATHPVSSADEAILAAAAATGAEIGWVGDANDRHGADDEAHSDRAPRRTGMLRAAAGPLVAVALLLAAGFGLYSVLGLGGNDGPAPVLVADTAPIKQVPAAKSPVEQAQQSIVFNEMDGVVPGAEEQLVSRDQADVNEVTALPPTSDISEEGLANRKVRTVTVRPDGTIVSGEDSVAGATILPVDRPNVPAVPGANAAGNSLLASAGATAPTPAAAAAPATPLVPGSEIAVVDAAGAPIAGKTAPVPYIRPASVGDAPATGPVDAIVETPQASLPPPPAQNLTTAVNNADPQQPVQAAAAAAPPTSNAAAYAQLSSQRSPEVAQQVASDLSARYASLLNGVQLEVSRADLGERGTYYRVRVPAASRENAAQFCASVVASGGDCLAM